MSLRPTREGWVDGLLEAARRDSRVVLIDADISRSVGSTRFRDEFPTRWVNVGICEQDMLAEAAGMALAGLVPFVESYAVFVAGRAWEHIRTSVCHMRLPVKIGGAHAGLSAGPDGATHQALEDIELMRVLPGMTVLVPADASQAEAAALAALETEGPCYVRFGRNPAPVVFPRGCRLGAGGADVMEDGGDVLIVSSGACLQACLDAHARLRGEGVAAAVVNVWCLKPFPADLVRSLAAKTGCAVSVCDHQKTGGLFGALAEALVQGCPVPAVPVCVNDTFGTSGEPEELFALHGLDADSIVEAAHRAMKSAGSSH